MIPVTPSSLPSIVSSLFSQDTYLTYDGAHFYTFGPKDFNLKKRDPRYKTGLKELLSKIITFLKDRHFNESDKSNLETLKAWSEKRRAVILTRTEFSKGFWRPSYYYFLIFRRGLREQLKAESNDHQELQRVIEDKIKGIFTPPISLPESFPPIHSKDRDRKAPPLTPTFSSPIVAGSDSQKVRQKLVFATPSKDEQGMPLTAKKTPATPTTSRLAHSFKKDLIEAPSPSSPFAPPPPPPPPLPGSSDANALPPPPGAPPIVFLNPPKIEEHKKLPGEPKRPSVLLRTRKISGKEKETLKSELNQIKAYVGTNKSEVEKKVKKLDAALKKGHNYTLKKKTEIEKVNPKGVEKQKNKLDLYKKLFNDWENHLLKIKTGNDFNGLPESEIAFIKKKIGYHALIESYQAYELQLTDLEKQVIALRETIQAIKDSTTHCKGMIQHLQQNKNNLTIYFNGNPFPLLNSALEAKGEVHSLYKKYTREVVLDAYLKIEENLKRDFDQTASELTDVENENKKGLKEVEVFFLEGDRHDLKTFQKRLKEKMDDLRGWVSAKNARKTELVNPASSSTSSHPLIMSSFPTIKTVDLQSLVNESFKSVSQLLPNDQNKLSMQKLDESHLPRDQRDYNLSVFGKMSLSK